MAFPVVLSLHPAWSSLKQEKTRHRAINIKHESGPSKSMCNSFLPHEKIDYDVFKLGTLYTVKRSDGLLRFRTSK